MPIKLIEPGYRTKETLSKHGADFNFEVMYVDRHTETVLFMSPEYGVLRHRWSDGVRQWDGAHWQSAGFLSNKEIKRLTKSAAAALSHEYDQRKEHLLGLLTGAYATARNSK